MQRCSCNVPSSLGQYYYYYSFIIITIIIIIIIITIIILLLLSCYVSFDNQLSVFFIALCLQ